ncbi:GNAT family N-acetyltransferase [Brachybacterium hainanense]|uniref:GNAT family N-acetyltransferase n=1 Tax=Brachybacterium hainanense TaxID=1541174 RepID=A0ABV6R6D8_9MICO
MSNPLAPLFPPFGLTLRAGDLTLRLLRDEDLPEYAELLTRPIFPDEDADHVFPWYLGDPEARVRNALMFQWTKRAEVAPERWNLTLGIWAQGGLIGSQDVNATDFPRRRVVSSGSWLTLDAHGRGYGKLMRQMILVLAFDHLGALRAESAAVLGNAPSFGVSRACGYEADGTEVVIERDRRLVHQRFSVTPQTVVRPAVPVEVEGLSPELRAMLGAPEPAL